MNYPFLYQKIHQLDLHTLRQSIILKNTIHTVWDDWVLKEISSHIVETFLKTRISHLKVFNKTIYLSEGVSSHFHIDRYHSHHLLHRLLIPLQDNFKYEWMVNENKIAYQPVAGEAILFNNMLPHRFVSEKNELRQVIYIDLYDPLVENYLETFKGNYSQINATLTTKYGK